MNTKLAFLSHAVAILFGVMATLYYKRSESTDGEASFVTNRELRPGCRPLRPACAQDADLVARFGPQLCQNAIQAQFDRFDNHVIEMRGLQNFLQPNFSTPLIDTLCTQGQLALTYEQVQSVCVTKCQKDSNCVAVMIIDRFPDESSLGYTGKSSFKCVMVNPALGPGAYLKSYSQDQADLDESAFVTFVKKSGPSLTSFEDIACNIDGARIPASIACQFYPSAPNCDTLLTDDYNKFVAPAIACVGGLGGVPTVNECLTCLAGKIDQTRDVCPINATDNSTVIRDLNECGNVCFPDFCESEITSAMLCANGAPPTIFNVTNTTTDEVVDRFVTTAVINGPNFTCPSVE